MTIMTIESDSDVNTQKIIVFVEGLGLHVKTDEHRVLSHHDIVFGIGRPATDAELREYLSKPDDGMRVGSNELKSKYSK